MGCDDEYGDEYDDAYQDFKNRSEEAPYEHEYDEYGHELPGEGNLWDDKIAQFRWSLAVFAGAFVLLPRELAVPVLVLYVFVVFARSSGVARGIV